MWMSFEHASGFRKINFVIDLLDQYRKSEVEITAGHIYTGEGDMSTNLQMIDFFFGTGSSPPILFRPLKIVKVIIIKIYHDLVQKYQIIHCKTVDSVLKVRVVYFSVTSPRSNEEQSPPKSTSYSEDLEKQLSNPQTGVADALVLLASGPEEWYVDLKGALCQLNL